MKYGLIFFLALITSHLAVAEPQDACSKTPGLFKKPCKRLHQIWYDGKNELYIPAYAWHNRFYYSADRIDTYNENPWGGGLGKRFYDEDGDQHVLCAFAFLDSHKNLEPILGYAFLKTLHFNDKADIGAGYALVVTSRPDILHSVPFPGILPVVAATYQRASVSLLYIPGGHNVGNVLFVLARWMFN